ncbi:uncharacterized protein [Antedon mediterranea]|uniref:uncharacterized protein n=1 Tax=Antedon mediterranea TaxID=105859 RepID=UPI003AF9CDDA
MDTELNTEWDDVNLEREGMKGGADPLLSQEPASVLPSYKSLMNSDLGHDFSDDKLLKSGRLYSLYLLNSEHSNEIDKKTTKEQCSETAGNDEALYEGMPFYEMKGKDFGPCAYCNMWKSVHFMSYCRRYPFCSVSCTKKFAVCKKEKGELQEKSPDHSPYAKNLQVPTLFPQDRAKPLFPAHEGGSKVAAICSQNGLQTFSWTRYLESECSEAAPIKCFHHAPMFKEWKSSMLSALIEVNNRDGGEDKDYFWIARIVQVAGYKALLRFEGYGIDSSKDFWVHLCKIECYPVNGAEKVGRKLRPPKDLMEKIGSNWLEFVNRVAHQGAPTIQISKELIEQELRCPFQPDMQLEAVYKRMISSTCSATIQAVVSNRLQVQYDTIHDPNRDFWYNSSSPLIHPIGWSRKVGHPLIDTSSYKNEALDRGRHTYDAPSHLFKDPPLVGEKHNFHNGMKLEAVDPLKLGNICVATICCVLRDGYLMVEIDSMGDAPKKEPFCYHRSSASILPVGFCDYHKIELVPPQGYTNIFDWDDYLRRTNSLAAPVELFQQDVTNPGWKIGHKVEAVDLIESSFICVGTITKIAGPLIQVHFDGWDSSYDQWVEMHSRDLYPVGWCEMTSYPLQPPKISEKMEYSPPVPVLPPSVAKKKKSTSSCASRKRKNSECNPSKQRISVDSVNADAIYRFSDEEDLCFPLPKTKPSIEKKKKPSEKKTPNEKKCDKKPASKKVSEKKKEQSEGKRKVEKISKKLEKKSQKNLKLNIDKATGKQCNLISPDVLDILSRLKKEVKQSDEKNGAVVDGSVLTVNGKKTESLLSPKSDDLSYSTAVTNVAATTLKTSQLKQKTDPPSYPTNTVIKNEPESIPTKRLIPNINNIPHLDLNSTSQGALLRQIALSSNKSKATKTKQKTRNCPAQVPKKTIAKTKAEKPMSVPNSPIARTSHLATLLNLPGQIDLIRLEPHIYNGFVEPRSKLKKNDSISLGDNLGRYAGQSSDVVKAFALNNPNVCSLQQVTSPVTSPQTHESVLSQTHSVQPVGMHPHNKLLGKGCPTQESISDHEKSPPQHFIPMTPPLPSPVQNVLRPELPPFASLTQHWRGPSEPLAMWATSSIAKTISSNTKLIGDPMTPAASPTSSTSNLSLQTQYTNTPINFSTTQPPSPYMLIPAGHDGKQFAMKAISVTSKPLQMIDQPNLQSIHNLASSPNASPQHSMPNTGRQNLLSVPPEQIMQIPRLINSSVKVSPLNPLNSFSVQYARLAHNSTAALQVQKQNVEKREEEKEEIQVRSPNFDPWKWSVSAVVQFLIDAGEGSCADTFRRQKIDGLKFMSLTKDQIAKLTGMKVAPSLKIYHQIELLRSHYPSPTVT